MCNTLLTVSGTIPDNLEADVAAGKRPLPDYLAMSRAFPADLLDYPRARAQAGWFGRLLEKVGGANLMLAWVCFRLNGRYRTIFTDGEQIGIFLALFSKFLGLGRPRAHHLMIVHILSVGKKMKFFDWFGIQSHVDVFFCYSTWQKQFIEERWNVPPERVVFTPFMVDSDFFTPDRVDPADPINAELAALAQGKPIICSVGLEFRDYPTLMTAVRDLPIHVIIAAGSPWSKRSDSTAEQEIPPNVTVRRFTQYQLRQVYAASAFVVMPLYNVNFQAGVTAILEGMALGKAILCSRTPGQTDVVVEGETGLYAPPENAAALREKIVYLLEHEREREEMGSNGRALILSTMNLRHYVTRLATHL
ncbi:MAG: glycosyltransferase family 4 protein [Anaerolineales bacterium]|nr:glycosyltransferase family 4 protein [Anaerolineales bacterium]MCB8983670.1 glycosyltransferase family 4 protein [Ardenticatenaceae bacterium]